MWWHADMAYLVNNNGECVTDLSVSVDAGETWIPFYQNAEPQRVVKSYNKFTLDPEYDGSAVIGGWPVLGSGSLTKSFNGLHGRVHFPLPTEVINKADVRIRVRYFEPGDAWWIAIDNIVVDDVTAPVGAVVVLDEKFEGGIPPSWKTTTSGANSWGTQPARDADGNFYRRFTFKDVDDNDVIQYVNIDLIREGASRIAAGTNITAEALLKLDNQSFTDFPDLVNTNPNEGKLDGRFIMSLAGGNYAIRSDSRELSEINELDTPSMNLTDATSVFLSFDSEALPYTPSTRYEVQISTNGGETFDQVFSYMRALLDLGESASFTRHHIELPQAAGKANVIVRFHAEGGDASARGFWVIDNVSVTANKSAASPIQVTAAPGLGGKVDLTWIGGQGPFALQKKVKLSDDWATVTTVGGRAASVNAEGATGFFRVIEGAAAR